MDAMIGRNLGKYQIVEPLGEGGMATVYKAYDPSLERYVAVKVIRAISQIDPNFLARFQREARALAKLDHPYILKVLDYGEENGIPYLVMPYVAQGTLRQHTRNRLPYTRAIKLIIPIAEALGYAHQRKIIHRDIKPANILFGESGEPILSDFGIAKIIDAGEQTQLTGTGIGIGTPDYMAPEQWNGIADERTDVYALGIVLYELITGRPPFHAETPAAILLKQVQEPLPRPRNSVPDLPECVENLLFKALAKDPNHRFQSMAAFVTAMENALQGKSVSLSDITAFVDGAGAAQTVASGQPLTSLSDNSPAAKSKPKWLPWAIGGGALLAIACLFIIGVIALTQLDLFNRSTPTDQPDSLAQLEGDATENEQSGLFKTRTPAATSTNTPQPTQPQSVDTIERLPEDIPVFTPNNGDVMTTDTQGTLTFTYSTAEDHTTVEAFFEEGMVAHGWSLISTSDMSAQKTVMYAFSKDPRYTTITISASQTDRTYIMVMPGE
jgi:serine/threonine protein kinase